MNWVVGVPAEASWYLVAVRTNDLDELYYVLQLWFDPYAHPKWWVGGGYTSNHAEPYAFQENVFAYASMPEFSEQTRLSLKS